MSVRFAPSPTGAFHVGNFRTAWISHRWALELGMPWVLRFEDIDTPRVMLGAMQLQIREMESLGLHTKFIELQSARASRHWEVFLAAIADGLVYPCFCSRQVVRRSLEDIASAPHGPMPIYEGRCRNTPSKQEHLLPTLAWRFRGIDPSGVHDFIVARTGPRLDSAGSPSRKHFTPAYLLACAVDDYDGRHALLVRAWDLCGVAQQQRDIQRWLARNEGNATWTPPAVFHCALVTRDNGGRLEKRTRGVTLAELTARGIQPETLVARLRSSFHTSRDEFSPSLIFGEKEKAEITLSELGLQETIV